MCELLVRVVDKTNATDPYADAACTKRGDVITAQPDGWVWGVQEQIDPQYRIVKVPGVSVQDVASLLVPEPDLDPLNPSRMLQARLFRLDLDGISAQLDTWLASDRPSRKRVFVLHITRDDLLARRVRKQPLPDPNIL
jgi:hypothetical protein